MPLPLCRWLLPPALLCAACGHEPKAAPERYTVRAEVVELASEGERVRATLRHEAIPEFKDREGEPVGMKAMMMAFGLARGVDRTLFVPGRKLELDFDAAYGREPMLKILRARPLADDVPLEL